MSSSALLNPRVASPTNALPLPSPPAAAGSVHRYQSVAGFMSSIWVAAVATPNRNPPFPASPASGPSVPNMTGVLLLPPSSPHAAPHNRNASRFTVAILARTVHYDRDGAHLPRPPRRRGS